MCFWKRADPARHDPDMWQLGCGLEATYFRASYLPKTCPMCGGLTAVTDED